MANIRAETKAEFQAGLERRLAKHDKRAALKQFARQYFSQVPLAEVVQKDWEYAEGTLLSSWHFFEGFNGSRPMVRVFNPKQERDGYEHRQTVIEVACGNIPFLLDSIRIELNKQEVVLSDVEQCVMSVVRKDDGSFVFTEDERPNETLIHLEVDRVSNTRELERDIRTVIRQVQRVVDDFAPIRKQLLLWSDEIGTAAQAHHDDSDDHEDTDFLRWLYSNNFTFLGYEEFEEGKLIPGSLLGLARKHFHCHGQPADDVAVSSGQAEITYAKSPLKSRVHRPAYMDCITVRFGARMCRFTGLFTSTVYNQAPTEIPIVRRKIEALFERTGLSPTSHKGRELSRIIEVLPREELFLASAEELAQTVDRIAALQERRIVRVLARRDRNGHFVNCLVYVPRDAYDTNLRMRIQEMLVDRFDASDAEFSTFFSESALTRTHFVLKVDPASPGNVDLDEIEQATAALTRSWEDDLHSVLVRSMGESEGERVYQIVRDVFPPGYKDDYWPSTAYSDIEVLLRIDETSPLEVSLYQWIVGGKPEIRFKLFHLGKPLPLSDVIPILENLGAKTIEEHPYELVVDGKRISIHDFVLQLSDAPAGDLGQLKPVFEEAFVAIWSGGEENDGFNRLIPGALMNHRQVSVIRAYSRYLGQIQSTSSQTFIADCVVRYSAIASSLFELFDQRFNPDYRRTDANARVQQLKSDITAEIDAVENLADDRVLRRFLEMMLATVRTNYFQPAADGGSKQYLSLKFLPELITEMPLPKPRFEIFVYSPRVEGVHLRGGKIARGGLRWSDRTEDYRTEVLGLVKAQQVKNSVIVPVGAKGGFLPRHLPVGGTRDEIMEEGVACYRIFISGLLDVTDNLVKGKVVPPKRVVRHDEDDTYLVVAADKGTATFSDIANELAGQYGFWLGDAFASGGSVGYDHKAMGITARGAWKSVQQHFRDEGVDVQSEPFSVVAIGDMSGDVFGNGMLQSDQIQLVGAFNHLHIFVDPDPEDTKACFAERQRLFDMGRSSWTDYDTRLISKGGGVFNRSAKSIPISAEMKKCFGISAQSLTPTALISAMLRAKVDLLWNGGIGTYVKSHRESHLDVGDKTNDALRVNASELRCRVVGEGGNLGMTQLARVEYSLGGGRCFTDFIDNAGGVNCSDAEVNIKILLNQLVEKRKLSLKDRKSLLRRMTTQVADLVLDNNYSQAQAINLMEYQSGRRGFEYLRMMNILADHGGLNPQLEFLPSDEEMQERRSREQTFTAPELSVLISYLKNWLKEDLSRSALMDEPYLIKEMNGAFPSMLVKKYEKEMLGHRLRREIVATQVANDMVNRMGINFVTRMSESAGVDSPLIAKAYVGARDIFDMDKRWDEIRALDYQVAPHVQKDMMLDLIRLIRRTTRWLLRNRRQSLHLDKEVPVFRKALREIESRWDEVSSGAVFEEWSANRERLLAQGVTESLATFVGAAHYLYAVLGIVEASNRTGESVRRVSELYFAVGERLRLYWFSRQVFEFEASSQWEALARESIQDDLNWQQLAITLGVIGNSPKGSRKSAEALLDDWISKHSLLVDRWLALESEMRSTTNRGPAVFTVAIRELLDLAQSSSGGRVRF